MTRCDRPRGIPSRQYCKWLRRVYNNQSIEKRYEAAGEVGTEPVERESRIQAFASVRS